jgi:hypothetical protein
MLTDIDKGKATVTDSIEYASELVFTKLILEILYWISEIVIHSRVVILDLTASIDMGNLYYYIFAGNWVVYSLFYCLGKCRDA